MEDRIDKRLDVDLWNCFRDGDMQAFSCIYRTHVQTLYQYGSKISSDDELVMDCIHDLFVDLSNNRKTIGPTDNIKYYLIKSLKNRIIKCMNKRTHADINNYPFLCEAAFDEHFEDRESLKRKRRYLRDVLNKLPDRQKEAIYLRYINNLNNDEISQIMNINYQAVRNTLYKAIDNLRKSISREDMIFFLTVVLKNRICCANVK